MKQEYPLPGGKVTTCENLYAAKGLRGRKALNCKYYQRDSKDPLRLHLPMEESSDRPEFSPNPEKRGCNYYPEPPILKVEELKMSEEKIEEVFTPYGVYHLGELIQEINDILEMNSPSYLKLNDIKKLLKEVEHLKTRDTGEIAEQAGTVLRNLEEKKDILYGYSDAKKIKDLVTRWDERIKET